ncbi:hypothetical protein N0V82_001935 [Gnomoniopsis sp. IMI 355080]|nr:hypothetical protein N0V82_001935 [Gnomoniopsis sp. IMI 355080]
MDSLPPSSGKLRPNLTGASETLLAILAARALDANSKRPILGDAHATRIFQRLDYDFSKLGVRPFKAAVLALRARYLDRWVAAFLAQAQQQHETVTVLHLAAGLDTRALRLQDQFRNTNDFSAEVVHWVDVELPAVVDVRRRLRIPEPTGPAMRYELKAADVSEENWLAKLGLPRYQRTFVVFEGLTMYLDPARGHALIRDLTDYFVAEGNQMAFDCIHSTVVLLQKFEPIVRNTSSSFRWAINEPKELEACHNGLQLREEISAVDNPFILELSVLHRCLIWLISWIPGMKKLSRFVRYEW